MGLFTRAIISEYLRPSFICVYNFTRLLCYKSDIVIESNYPNVNVPNITINELLWDKFATWPDRPAVVCSETGKTLTYNDFFKKSRKLSGFLQSKLKLKKDDTIALVLPNIADFGVIVLGAVDAGLKVTTINPLYTKDEIKRQLNDCGVKAVFSLNIITDLIKEVIKTINNSISVISVGIQRNEPVSSGIIKFHEITENSTFEFRPVSGNADDVAFLLYSSGTTGLPKGVELTHKNIVSNVLQQSSHEPLDLFNLYERNVVSTSLAFFHSGGLSVALLSWYSGSKLIAAPRINTKTLTDQFETYKPNIGVYTPLIVQMLTKNNNFTPKIAESLKIALSAAAPLGGTDIERFYEKTQNQVRIIQGYGLTEASPATHRVPLDAQKEKIRSVGVLLPNTKSKIIPIDGNDTNGLPVMQTGEILIKGPQVMKGYFKNPKATSEIFTDDGWLKTGDVGYVDEDGYLYITDRIKELIKVKGFQVAPAELEEILRDHPSVEQAAVVGTKHERFGEVPKAFLVLKKDHRISEEDIKEFVANKVVTYKQLEGGVVFLEDLPKSNTGKILRKELKGK
ncbi:4-coumarate--CoA ligase-like [Agrilus planipennis]|uniref:4-coumarate--CoA ligase-like n=1 Tax=Agrilus planipennis TaxID=224129 RepID=A0A1W4XCX3_AGRPL|nr:4-coumarate--CoA ligase-like [Agrilus planipennis]